MTSHLGEIPYTESEYNAVDNFEIRENWHREDCTFLRGANEINLRVSCTICYYYNAHSLLKSVYNVAKYTIRSLVKLVTETIHKPIMWDDPVPLTH